MMGSFITGSQTEAHKLRMFKEAIKFLFRIACCSVVIFVIFFFYNTPKYELKVTLYYYQADFLKSFKKNTDLMEIVDSKGVKKKVQIGFVLKNPEVIKIKNTVTNKLTSFIGYSLFVPVLLPFWFWFQGKRRSAKRTLRGIEKVDFKILLKLVREYNDKILRRKLWKILEFFRYLKCKVCKQEFKQIKYEPYIIANNIEYPAFTEHQHTFITGGSGTGKTVLLSSLIDQIKNNGDIAIIYDKMGSFIPYFYEEGKDIILNPFDERGVKWSVFSEIRQGKEETDLRSIASGLIPKNKNGDNYWNEQAQNLFIETCKELIKLGKANNETLAEFVLKKGFYELREFFKDSDVKQMFENDEQMKTTQSIRSTLVAYTHFLKILKPAQEEDKTFSIRKFIEEGVSETTQNGGKFLFLSSRSDVHDTLQPLLTCQIDIVINTLLSLKQQKEKNIWIIIDELPSINPIPTLDAGLSQARQFGGSFVLSMQLISQLRDIYGDRKADTMSGNCKTRIVFASPDVNTAKWTAESLGRKEVDEVKEGMTFGANEVRDGVSLSRNNKIEELVIPSEIQMLPNLCFYLRLPFHFPISKINIKPKQRKIIAEGFFESRIEDEKEDETGDANILIANVTEEIIQKKPLKTKKNIFEED
jgi:type IV conjugative transfer system coupling protein TraD